jgi:hypothetical protein
VLKPIAVFLTSLVLPLAAFSQNPDKAADSVPGQPIKAFRTVSSHKGNFIRVDPGVDWSRYGSYRFSPATYEPSSGKHRLTAWQAEEIEARIDASLQKVFRIRGESSGLVLEVRPVITDVKKVIPWVNLLSFAAVQAPVSFGGLAVRCELFNSATGALVGEISSTRNARPWNVYPWDILQNFQTLGHSSILAKRDARTVRKDLYKLASQSAEKTQEMVAKYR